MTESELPTPEMPAAPAVPPAPTVPVMAPPVFSAPLGGPAEPVAAPRRRGKRSPDGRFFLGTGRRKASVARVRISPAAGGSSFVVNGKPYNEFFRLERDQRDILAVLEKTRTDGKVNVSVTVHGGGTTGQAGAIVLGLGRALATMDSTLEGDLREHGFLTRDPREVERKKYGQSGARRRYQFSKR
jgi:small subunit ribosomal protein S9